MTVGFETLTLQDEDLRHRIRTITCRRCGMSSQRIQGTQFSQNGKRDYYRKVGPLRTLVTAEGKVYQHVRCPAPLKAENKEHQR